jgi:Protein of unknown function (DUF1003)
MPTSGISTSSSSAGERRCARNRSVSLISVPRHGSRRAQRRKEDQNKTLSLEAIFLSTSVMIGQNRQAAFQQAKADHDFEAQELELKTNTELTRQIQSPHRGIERHFIGGSA